MVNYGGFHALLSCVGRWAEVIASKCFIPTRLGLVIML